MKKIPLSLLVLGTAGLLAACGGSDSGDPAPTPRGASVVVSGATDTSLNGTYSATTVSLNDVEKFNPIGGEPETCRFRFSGLQQVGSTRLMDGDIRYIPGTTETRTTFVSINGNEFRLQGTTGAVVDKGSNEIDYNGAVLTSTLDVVGAKPTIVLTGSIPMRTGRPEGC